MRVIKLVGGLAIILALVMNCAAMAAPENAAEKTAAAAPVFDQSAVLDKLWNSPDDTVLATVNGEKVTKGELLKMLWAWNAPGALEELINQKMIQQSANAANVTVDPMEVQLKIQDQIKNMPDAKTMDFKTILRKYNMTETRLRQSTLISLLAEKTVQKDVKISEDQFADWAKARHILIRPNAQEQDKEKADADAKARAERVIASIKSGQKFEDLAAQQSDDLSNKDKGGDLGWFKKGRMVKEFEDAIFGTADKPGLKAGELSNEPVKSMFGYHIIEVQNLGATASPEEKAEIRDMILQEEAPAKMRDWYSNLKASAKITNELNPLIPPAPAPEAMTPPPPEP